MNNKSINYLRKEVFKTDEYYQFELLFSQAREVEKTALEPLGILERAYIYNGKSIFSSVFTKIKPTPIDYQPISANKRTGLQSSWIEKAGLQCPLANSSVIDTGTSYFFKLKNKKIRSLLIPNVLHHCRDFSSMMSGLLKKLPELKCVYIFDSYVRENHQDPDDFCRYTPAALKKVFDELEFKESKRQEIGNVFDCILYFISQAKENLKYPENRKLKQMINRAIPFLKEKRCLVKYRSLRRSFASAATGYAMRFEKK